MERYVFSLHSKPDKNILLSHWDQPVVIVGAAW